MAPNGVAIVKALVDSGAERSFIDKKAVAALKIPLEEAMDPLQVRLADGTISKIGVIDKVAKVELGVGSHHQEVHLLYPMTLGGSTVILGLDWLSQHKPRVDFDNLKIDFISEYCSEKCLSTRNRTKTIEVAEVALNISLNALQNDWQFLVQKLSPLGKVPTRGSPEAAGFDLYSAEEITIPAGERRLIKTNIAVRVPKYTYGRIAPRSGLSLKASLDVAAGVIDRDYTGDVGILLVNDSGKSYLVKIGDKIAQLILEKIASTKPTVVKELKETQRGQSGFGSTDEKIIASIYADDTFITLEGYELSTKMDFLWQM